MLNYFANLNAALKFILDGYEKTEYISISFI